MECEDLPSKVGCLQKMEEAIADKLNLLHLPYARLRVENNKVPSEANRVLAYALVMSHLKQEWCVTWSL